MNPRRSRPKNPRLQIVTLQEHLGVYTYYGHDRIVLQQCSQEDEGKLEEDMQ